MKLNHKRGTKMKNFSFFIFTFLFIMMSTSLWGEFSRDSSGVVADSKSGLAWQDDYRDNGGEIKKVTWQDALVYCHELNLGGQNDWRLPNMIELYSLLTDRSNIITDRINISSVFQNVSSSFYWSSTTYASHSSWAWYIGFNSGHGDTKDKMTDELLVRCVRGGQ